MTEPIYGPHEKKLTQFCERLEITPEQFTGDLYKLCRWMQDEGHHYSMRPMNLKHRNEMREKRDEDLLPIYFLETDSTGMFLSVVEGIMFYSNRSKWEGWGINKNPVIKSEKYECWAWEQRWLEKTISLIPERI